MALCKSNSTELSHLAHKRVIRYDAQVTFDDEEKSSLDMWLSL